MFDDDTKTIIDEIAKKNLIEPACLMAVCQVESGGKLFANIHGNREPLIRFEGHWFYRLLQTQKRNRAVVNGLANKRAGKVKNPRSQTGRWKLLQQAVSIDRHAALQSTSWGIGQVMGLHWRWLGFASVDAMVSTTRSGAEGQVDMMVRYIKKAKLIEFMRDHDWAGFARAYNGPAYVKYGYQTKLAKAYEQHKNLNTVKLPKSVLGSRHQVLALRLGSQGVMVRELQENLRKLDYSLSADGDFGPVTQKTVMSFQKEKWLKTDGIVGPKTQEMIARFLPQPANLL